MPTAPTARETPPTSRAWFDALQTTAQPNDHDARSLTSYATPGALDDLTAALAEGGRSAIDRQVSAPPRTTTPAPASVPAATKPATAPETAPTTAPATPTERFESPAPDSPPPAWASAALSMPEFTDTAFPAPRPTISTPASTPAARPASTTARA